MKTQLGLGLLMFAVYVLARRWAACYAVIRTLLAGIALSAATGLLKLEGLALQWAAPVLVLPTFSFAAIVGVALSGTIGNSRVQALREESERAAALVTFLVTASGIALFGIGSAFWGLLAGSLALLIWKR